MPCKVGQNDELLTNVTTFVAVGILLLLWLLIVVDVDVIVVVIWENIK